MCVPAYSACWLCVCVGGEVCLHGNTPVLNLWHVRLTTDVLAHFNSWCQSGIYCVHIKLGFVCKCFESLQTRREESGERRFSENSGFPAWAAADIASCDVILLRSIGRWAVGGVSSQCRERDKVTNKIEFKAVLIFELGALWKLKVTP